MRSTNQNGAGTSGEHEQQPGAGPNKVRVVPHWNAILGLVVIGVLYALLPTKVSIGPSWLLLAIEGVFLLPFVIAMLTRRSVSPVTLRVGSLILLGIVTVALAVGVGHMILTLPKISKGLPCCILGCCCMVATSSCPLYGTGKLMEEAQSNVSSPTIKRLTSCFPNRWADMMETGRHIFLITSTWALPEQLLLVQPIPCPCHIVRNFS